MTNIQQSQPPAEPAREPTRRAGLSITVALAIVLIVLFAVFALQNTNAVRMEFLTWTFEAPTIVLLLLTGALFVTLDQILGYLWRRRRRQRKIARALRKG